MDRKLNYLIVWCSTLICICGGSQDLPASCEVMLTVRRGTIRRVAPRENLKVSCPVKHCGESLDVTWCKVVHINYCERIHKTENVEIRQNYGKDNLISYLSFKKVSVNDDGLYRCEVIGHTPELFSHAINISVSVLPKDENQEAETSDDDADDSPTAVDVSWLPYFSICLSLVLLVTVLIALTLLRYHGLNRKWTCNYIKGEERSTHMIPSLPKRTTPSAPDLDTHVSVLNDIYVLSTTATTSRSPHISTGCQPVVVKTADKESNSAAYAVINYRQCGTPARNPYATSKQDNCTEYAAVKLH